MEDEWDDELLSKIDHLESLHLQQRQAAVDQQQQSAGQPQQQWACRSCTLLNAAASASCAVCGTPRGRTFDPAAASSAFTSAAGGGAGGPAAQAARKTVQATLAFAPPSQPARRLSSGAQPVPAPPSDAFGWQQQPPQQQQQQQLTRHQQQRRAPPTASPEIRQRPQHQNAFPGSTHHQHQSPALPRAASVAIVPAQTPATAPRTSPFFQSRQPAVPATETEADDEVDDPDEFNQRAWPIAYATQQRRSGEDAQAKTRYLDIINRSSFPDIDMEAAHQFVYPTNYPIREYQLTIAEKALYHNTMVSLPTGLGKTLIASVVMYNFYRWFPQGKIVFMAPTKPLVAQQIQACHEIMGIPLADTAELQGNVPPSTRKVLWREKRVFFCTPQSMQNDLRHGICEAERFVCLVVDEAHRATGNYAYCCVIQEIERKTQFFRVLALSATPGSKFEIIQDVIKNLRISHIESRSADDADVKKYTHARQEEVIKCTLSSQITEVKALYLRVFERITNRLVTGNIIQHRDPDKLTRWYVLQMRERFRQSPTYQANRAAESDLALLVSLLHAKELLTVHGLSSFHEYVNGWIEERESGARLSWSKKEMLQSTEFHSLVLSLSALGMDHSNKTTNGKSSSSHPKLLKLREVLHEHFTRHSTGSSSTRAIVFTQYRTSVTEIVSLLSQMTPLLKVQAFVGQGASGKAKESKGQSQKQQQEIVKKFRNGEFNVLVATCIAEEGLDIGEVDLIVSFDALTSPVRMIQRMGRTGRKRVGRVIILVTEGDEEKKLARSVASAKTVSRAMTTFKSKFLYAKCPRMLPLGIQPELSKLEMAIPEFHASQIAGKRQRTGGQGSRQRQTENGDESARRRWQLNDIEKSIGTARYFPTDFRSRPRNPIFPVIVRPGILLRSVQVTVKGKDRKESDTFQVGHSTRSLALRALVRSIHGVDACDEEIVELDDEGGNDEDSDGLPSVVLPSPASEPSSAAARVDGWQNMETDTQAEAHNRHPVSDFSFSAHDASFVTQGVHFSPSWNDVVSPIALVQESVERHQHAAPSHSVAPTPLPVPPSPAPVAAVAKKSSEESPRVVRDRPEVTATRTPAPERSPSKKAKAALSSPSAKANSKKEKRKRSEGDHSASKDSGDPNANEFERGERLLERLRELVVETEAAASADSLCSPEPEVVRHSQSTATGSQPTKAPHALPCFPRITRRLDFETAIDRAPVRKQFGSTENCVPAPPSLDGLPATLRPPSPELTPDDEPVFTLLPTLPADLEAGVNAVEEDVGMLEESEPIKASVPAPAESSKPRRSLALKKTVHYAEDTKVTTTPAPSPPARVAQDHCSTIPVPAAPCDSFEAIPLAVKATAVPPPTSKPIVLDIDDSDDEVEIVLPPLPVIPRALPAQAKSTVVSDQPSREHLSQRSTDSESTGTLGMQTDCCSVCTEVESFEDDPIVYCDGCELGVHQFCYGIMTLPSGNWFCDSCAMIRENKPASSTSPYFAAAKQIPPSCALCPLRGGALKRTQCGRWAHVQCFMWLPELQLEQDREMLSLGSLKNLDPDRNTLDCTLCHSRKGRGIIQCAYKRCMVAFHVSCAAFAQYTLVQEEQVDGGDTVFLVYCPLHGRRRSPHGPSVQATPQQIAQQQTPTKPAAPNTASPSTLLFSPTDHGSAKRFRKFRRLKRKYDASQRSQSPGAVAAAAATSSSSTPGERGNKRLSWGKRIKRSQKYSEGKRKQAAAMAQMFIEDDVEVHGEDDGDEYDDMDDDDDADEHDDSFINDSSQLLYSPSSPPDSVSKDSSKRKKRKRESLGDMRAIYARSLLESQHDMPAFMRRGQRDFSALPQNGIVNACLQELRNPPPASPSSSAASFFSPQSVKSVGTGGAGAQESPISLLSPADDVNNSGRTQVLTPQSFVTPEGARRPQQHPGVTTGSIPSHPLSNAVTNRAAAAVADEDDFESVAPEPPSFSLLQSGSRSERAVVLAQLPSPTPARESVGGTTAHPPAPDEDRSLQERIEANRLKALEKLRERQRRLAQAPTHPAASPMIEEAGGGMNGGVGTSAENRSQVYQAPAAAAVGGVSVYGHIDSGAGVPPLPTPVRTSENKMFKPVFATLSHGNAVPEAPSFSLFPALPHEPIAEPRTLDLTKSAAEQHDHLQVVAHQQPIRQQHPPPAATARAPPQILVNVSSAFSQTAMFRALIGCRPPDAAVEIEDLLEADALLSARLAAIVASPQQLSAALQRNESEFLASIPRLHACASIFKRVVLVVQTGDSSHASALNQNLVLQRIRQTHANLDVVIRGSIEQTCQHLFDTAR